MISEAYYQLFLILGLVVSFEDWQGKRIKNRWIGLGLLLCGAGLAYLLLNSILGYRRVRFWEFGEYYLPWHYYPRVLVHLSLCLTAAFTLWRFSVWPAGDAKLYTLFAFFIALINPNLPGFPLLLFMVLLINIFVPAGLVFAVETVLRAISKFPALLGLDWARGLKAAADRLWTRAGDAWPHRYNYITLAVNLFALFFLMRLLERRVRGLAPGPFGHLLVFLFMFVAWDRMVKLLKNHKMGLASLACIAAAALARAFIDSDVWTQLKAGLRTALDFAMFLTLLRAAFYWFIERESLRKLEAEHLEPGVILSDETWEKLKAEKELEKKLGPRYCDGLVGAEVDALKSWLAAPGARREPAAYTIYSTIPFAVWIFMGALLTLSNRGDAVRLVTPYLQRAWSLLRAAGAARAS